MAQTTLMGHHVEKVVFCADAARHLIKEAAEKLQILLRNSEKGASHVSPGAACSALDTLTAANYYLSAIAGIEPVIPQEVIDAVAEDSSLAQEHLVKIKSTISGDSMESAEIRNAIDGAIHYTSKIAAILGKS